MVISDNNIYNIINEKNNDFDIIEDDEYIKIKKKHYNQDIQNNLDKFLNNTYFDIKKNKNEIYISNESECVKNDVNVSDDDSENYGKNDKKIEGDDDKNNGVEMDDKVCDEFDKKDGVELDDVNGVKVDKADKADKVDDKDKKISHEEQMNGLFLNLRINFIFYLVVLFCCFFIAFSQILEKDSIYKKIFMIIRSVFTFIIVMLFGHTIHWVSHNINCKELLDSCDNIIVNNKYIRFILDSYIDIYEFHDITHHDSSVNKQWFNIISEFIINFLSQSVLIVFCIQLLDFNVVILWGLFYATVHNINYYFIKPITHMQHHIKKTTNYGIDLTDILFNTKYDWKNIENYNHSAINIILISGVIIFFNIYIKDAIYELL